MTPIRMSVFKATIPQSILNYYYLYGICISRDIQGRPWCQVAYLQLSSPRGAACMLSNAYMFIKKKKKKTKLNSQTQCKPKKLLYSLALGGNAGKATQWNIVALAIYALGSRWAYQFRVVCLLFPCVGYPTRRRFPVEYGLKSLSGINRCHIYNIYNMYNIQSAWRIVMKTRVPDRCPWIGL